MGVSHPRLRPFHATRNPGVSEGFTDFAAAVQLRLRVAIGLQALQRCSGLLNRRARGSTVATYHFMPAWLSSDSSSFVNFRASPPLGSASLPVGPRFKCRVQSDECRMARAEPTPALGRARFCTPHSTFCT